MPGLSGVVVIDHVPPAPTVALPRAASSLKSVTVLPAVPFPVIVGFRLSLMVPPPALAKGEARARLFGAGGVSAKSAAVSDAADTPTSNNVSPPPKSIRVSSPACVASACTWLN